MNRRTIKRIEWESIGKSGCPEGTLKAKVPGGWILRSSFYNESEDDEVGSCKKLRDSTIFITDPTHLEHIGPGLAEFLHYKVLEDEPSSDE